MQDAELSLSANERICLVGRNGSGKSTLMKIAAGMVEADHGTRFIQPGITVKYLPQEPEFKGYKSIYEYAEAGLGPGDDRHRISQLFEQQGLSGDLNPNLLSGGEAKRAALTRILAPNPDILLLDEPTNHLDLPAIEWLENELTAMKSAIILISHDRRFLEKLSQSTVWLDRGQTHSLHRGFAHFEEWRDNFIEQEKLDRHKLDRKIVREADWLRYGVTARRKRNQRRLKELHLLRQKKLDQSSPKTQIQLKKTDSSVSGKLVIEAQNISKSFDDSRLVKNLSLRIARGDRVGIVGPNGIGKSTLVSLLTGLIEPDAGTVKLGANVEIVTLDQQRETLNPSWTLKEALTGGEGDTVRLGSSFKHVISYMKDFLFNPEQAGTPVSRLSGGERGRLMLARTLTRPSNLLVLDEPTNDLDLETLDILQEYLSDYQGTIVLVSHDRDFLDRIATSIVCARGEGEWIEFAGGYSDMEVQQRRNSDTAESDDHKSTNSERTKSSASSKKSVESKKRKLSYKEKFALENIPDQISALELKIGEYEAVLSDPELYQRDPETFNQVSSSLKTAQSKLAELEDEWLSIELLRETLENP